MITTALVPGIDSFSYFYTLFMTPLFLFSGVFFPVETLPRAVTGIAWLTPLYHLVNICRAFAAGNTDRVFGSIVWIVVVAAALAPVPFRLMRRRVIQ
jgi:lipooligosaccharide transport system permease protein